MFFCVDFFIVERLYFIRVLKQQQQQRRGNNKQQ